MEDKKEWYQSKTVWINVLTLILGILGVFATSELMSEKTALYITGLAIPVVNVVLRWLTDKPITSFTRSADWVRGK